MEPFVDLCVRNNIIAKVSTVNIEHLKEKQMVESVLEVHDELDKQAAKLRYLAEVEDKAGLSELLLDIASKISIVKYAECLKLKEEDEDGTTD